MSLQHRGLSILGAFLFAAGVLIGLLFFGNAVWADFEAFLFSPATGATNALPSYKCPVLLTIHESAEVSVEIGNPTGQEARRQVRFYSTDGFVTLIREETFMYDLAPGDKMEVRWRIYPQDAAYKRFVLVRAYLFALWPEPAKTSSCGVMVFSLGQLSSSQIISLAIAFSGLFMALGLALWANFKRPMAGRTLTITNGMRGLTLLIFGGMITALFGQLIVGALFLLMTFLMIVILLGLLVTTT